MLLNLSITCIKTYKMQLLWSDSISVIIEIAAILEYFSCLWWNALLLYCLFSNTAQFLINLMLKYDTFRYGILTLYRLLK